MSAHDLRPLNLASWASSGGIRRYWPIFAGSHAVKWVTQVFTMMTTVFRSENQPSWGMGLVVEDGDDHWVLVFEHGGRRKFIKSKTKGLVPVVLQAKELAALVAMEQKAHGRHKSFSSKAKPKKPGVPKKAVARFESFKQQVGFFEKLFVGGFEGERFIREERGAPGATGKAAGKTAAIALAQAELSAARFASATPEELFESATKLLKATTIVFPIEGAIAFAGIEPESRAATLAGLEQLLHGEGDYGVRLANFAASVSLKDKQGQAKSVTWPFVTVFGALFKPTELVCVKPTPFAGQAATLGLSMEKSQPVTALGYHRFQEVAAKTHALLLEAGHRPRDLMDVYSFIARTHAEKPPEAV